MPIDPRRILFEDEHLLIVTKLAGELVVAAGGEGKLPLFDFLKKDRPGLRVLHRIDFQTSGIVVFAKTAQAGEFVRQAKGDWEKTYVALVAGRVEPKTGTIDRPLQARTVDTRVPAVTHYRVLRHFPSASYVEARIETGRKHQIRQHFALIGHPLLWDPLYGSGKIDAPFSQAMPYRRFFLHSSRLTLTHPVTKERMTVVSPLPAAFEQALARLDAAPVVVQRQHYAKSIHRRNTKRRAQPSRRGGRREQRR